MQKLVVGLLATVFLMSSMYATAADTPNVVSDAEGTEAVSAIRLGCKKPWHFTQDCSGFSGPKKKLKIDGMKLKVAANESGTTTLMFGGRVGKTSNAGYDAMKQILSDRGFEVVKVTPVVSSGTVFGYIIETDQPSYHVWEEYGR